MSNRRGVRLDREVLRAVAGGEEIHLELAAVETRIAVRLK